MGVVPAGPCRSGFGLFERGLCGRPWRRYRCASGRSAVAAREAGGRRTNLVRSDQGGRGGSSPQGHAAALARIELGAVRRLVALLACCAALAACVTTHPALAPAPWEQRLADLQHANTWQLDGRAAVAVGTQGWQASLNWRQRGGATELHLAGPLGVGALVLKTTPEGLSLNGAPPSDTVLAQLQDRLGFELPLDELRYWL